MDNIIKYENEHTGLDFKATQYIKGKYSNLLKDIIAMANADYENRRLIIVGIKHHASGEREFQSIEKKDFIDSATYQQLINENIEPHIDISYEPHIYENNITLGIFSLSNCRQQPYMLKKDYGRLKKGDCFVRKGSYQDKATRVDFERMYQKRDPFIDKIKIFFKDTKLKTINITSVDRKNITLESDRQIKKIEDLIKIKKLEKNTSNGIEKQLSIQINLNGVYVPLENRNIQELSKILETAKETYFEDDSYEYQEKYAYKLNLDIFNSSIEYIEDASIIITIPESNNYYIFDSPIKKPSNNSFLNTNAFHHSLEYMDYPSVDRIDNNYIIENNIGDIKHHIKTESFKSDLLMAFININKSYEVSMSIQLFGKNITYPIEKKLVIYVD